MLVVEGFVRRGMCVSRVVIASAVLCGCGTSQPGSDIGSTKNYRDPLPDPPSYVSDAADAVVFGHVLSSESFDVPDSEWAVVTLSVVAIDSVERGSLSPGDEVVVITDDGKTAERYTDAAHGAHPSVGLDGRFYLTSAAPGNPVFSNPAAMDAVKVRSGNVFTVSGGTEGLQVPHSALANIAPCEDPDGVPTGTGYCTRVTTDWKPWNPNAVIKYWVNPTTTHLTPSQVVMAVQSGVAAWNDEPSGWARFEYQGTTTLTTDGTKNIFAFTSDCPGRGNTVKSYGPGNRIAHFTTCFFDLVSWSFDTVMHTAIHESGHALGLTHINDPNQVMRSSPTELHYLGPGDRNFVHDFYRGPEIPSRGDFNGDGAPDLISFTNQATSSSAGVSVSLKDKTTNSFLTPASWNSSFAPRGETPLVGNFDGDSGHKDDIASFARQATGDVKVCLSNGSSFPSANCSIWSTGTWLTHSIHPEVGDVNHDGKADIVAFSTNDTGDVQVALSDGTKFGTPSVWHTYFGVGGEWTGVADVNQDGCADLVTMLNGAGSGMSKQVWVALSQACLATNPQNKFGTATVWSQSFCGPNKTPSVTKTGLSCVNLDGTSWTVAPVNAAKNGFDAEVEWGGTGGPVFNQTAFTYAYIYPYLVWFEHGTRAHGYARAAGGAPLQILNTFAPSPCPWNGVSGVCSP